MTQPTSLPDTIPTARPTTRRRVLLVDADHRVRDSLAGLIGLADGIDVVGATGHPDQALAAALETRPDLVVIDPRLPAVSDGVALIAALRSSRPATRIFVLGWEGALDHAELDPGVDGYIDKCADSAAFTEAVCAAARP